MISVMKFIGKLALFWTLLIIASVVIIGVQAIVLHQSYDWFQQEAYFASTAIFQFALASSILLALVATLGCFVFIFVLLWMDKE